MVGITNAIDNIVQFCVLGLCMNDWIITCFARPFQSLDEGD